MTHTQKQELAYYMLAMEEVAWACNHSECPWEIAGKHYKDMYFRAMELLENIIDSEETV